MLYWGTIIIASMSADFITFALFVPIVGIQAEANPVMAFGYTRYGISIVLLLKVLCTITILLLVARIERPNFKILAALLGISLGLLGAFGNTLAVIGLSRNGG